MSKYRVLPSQEYLQELFDYDETTGKLIRKKAAASTHVGQSESLVMNLEVTATRRSYKRTSVDGTAFMEHRLIYKMITGVDPLWKRVDHVDGDRGNNRIENLRLASASENACNRQLRNNSSGVTGVYLIKTTGKWQARIKVDGSNISLGVFDCREEAVKARHDAEDQYYGEFSYRASQAIAAE